MGLSYLGMDNGRKGKYILPNLHSLPNYPTNQLFKNLYNNAKMELNEAKTRAEKTLKLQAKMEDLFGTHPFYQELAITAALVEAAYQGKQEGIRKTLEKIPTNQKLEEVKNSLVEGLDYPVTYQAGFVEGANYIINALTDNLKDENDA